MEERELLNKDPEFRYQLLSRMVQDCNYYLGCGNRSAKHLWAQNEKEQIEIMIMLYNSFPAAEQPEWISLSEIEELENKMLHMNTGKMKAMFAFIDPHTGREAHVEVDDVEEASTIFPFLIMKDERHFDPCCRDELQNQPCFEGFIGPMWNGDGLRYETPDAYNAMV